MDKTTQEIPEIEIPQDEMSQTDYSTGQRKKTKKRRKKKHWLLRLFVLLMVIAGVVFCMSLDYFDIKTIKVEGNSYVPTETVIAESQIKVGDNLFKTNKKQVKKRMGENPYYEEIVIDKNLPNEILIKVKERVQSAVLPYGDRFVKIDKSGIVLGLENANPQLTEIIGITIREMDKGEVLVSKEEETFKQDLTILKEAENADLFFKKIKVEKGMVMCNVYDNLYLKGKYDEVIENMQNGNVKTILYDLHQKQIRRGTVIVDGENYCSFTPTFSRI